MVRNVDAPDLFETFLVSAILSVLAIRAFLQLTGFPRVGGERLHIAHMLWGGLGMLIALTLLLGWLGAGARGLAAIIGGIGFGAFIDELGKFITVDNDYFYRPAFALIYLTFVLLYLSFRLLVRRELTAEERIANALELMQEAVRHDLDANEKRRALELLGDDAGNPLAATLRSSFQRLDLVEPGPPGRLRRLRDWLDARYRSLIGARFFRDAVVVIVCLFAAFNVVSIVLFAFFRPGTGFEPIDVVNLVASAIPAVLLLSGLRHLRSSRLRTWQTFHTAILVQILVSRVVSFYVYQFGAVLGLLADVVVLSVVRTLIQQEQSLARSG